jgi:hypothetical protein
MKTRKKLNVNNVTVSSQSSIAFSHSSLESQDSQNRNLVGKSLHQLFISELSISNASNLIVQIEPTCTA